MFRASEHSRDDGGEVERRPDPEHEMRERLSPDVRPVVETRVRKFEQPPDRRGGQEQADVFPPAAGEERRAGAPKDQRIDRQAVAEPEREKCPLRAQSGQEPVEGPEGGDQEQSDPAVEG